MYKMLIEPGVGIGELRLGMNKNEVDEVIQYYIDEYEKGTNYFNFFENAFKIEYNIGGTVKFIEIGSEFKNFFECTCFSVDVFGTKANELVQSLSGISDHEEETNGETQFIFTNIGLSLWRSSVFTEETMQEEWFKEMCTENQEDEMQHIYFQTVAVFPNDDLYYKGLI